MSVLSSNDRRNFPAIRTPPSVGAVVQALAATPPMQYLVPKGSTVESSGRSALASGPHRPTADSNQAILVPQRTSYTTQCTTDSNQAIRVPQRTSLTTQRTPKVRVPGERISEPPFSAKVALATGLASSEEQSCRFNPTVGGSLSPEPCRRGSIGGSQGGLSPHLLGRSNSRSLDRTQTRDPQATKITTESCHIILGRPPSDDADKRMSLGLSSKYYTLSENLEQLKSTMEREVRACKQATMEEVADRKRMEERLQLLWQTSHSEEVAARTAAVCRLDSEMTLLSANVNALREDLQGLMDLMYGELHSLVQSMQGGANSDPQSRQGVQQRGHPVPTEPADSLDRALLPQEDVSNSPARGNSPTEHQLQHAADILARAGESAAALHEEQLAGMHNECRYVLEKLLDETVQGCVKYSIVKVAIFQALDALGTKETEALWRDTCWTLQKIEEWLTAKDRMAPGKTGLSAKKLLDAAQANREAEAIRLGTAGTFASARGSSHAGSLQAASTTASLGGCSHN